MFLLLLFMNKGETMTNFKYMKKLKKPLSLLLLPLASGANAELVTVPLSFATLPVISVDEETAMVFGQVLNLAQAATCNLSATAGTVIVQADDGHPGTTAAGGDLSGGCSGEGIPGVYTIKSVPGAEIQVSVVAGAATEISLAPIGVVINHTGPTRDPIDESTSTIVDASATINTFTAAGTNRVIMGGTVTNTQALTSGQAYTTTFDINVVYQ
jgi:hypothetical protein